MRYITADYIFPISKPPIKNGVVIVSDDGEIIEIKNQESRVRNQDIEYYNGIICPGFINTHCHLELSYLKGKMKEHAGLDEFIREVEDVRRNFSEAEIKKAIDIADEEMLRNGIVAVGDISNSNFSFERKKKSKIAYHTFIEVFAFHPDKAEIAFEKGKVLYEEYLKITGKENISLAPHASYSASINLLNKIKAFAEKNKSILTIHNQESEDEDLMFKEKRGKIIERLKAFGIDTSPWKATGESSLKSTLPHFPKQNKILLVHNTYTKQDDIRWAHAFINHLPAGQAGQPSTLFWCFCPSANLYIENRLPDFNLFISENALITIGTDSLASNKQLSVLEELKTISNHAPEIPLQTLLTWATKNGADFLGLNLRLGTIEKGKKPGLVLIENVDLKNFRLTPDSREKKLL